MSEMNAEDLAKLVQSTSNQELYEQWKDTKIKSSRANRHIGIGAIMLAGAIGLGYAATAVVSSAAIIPTAIAAGGVGVLGLIVGGSAIDTKMKASKKEQELYQIRSATEQIAQNPQAFKSYMQEMAAGADAPCKNTWTEQVAESKIQTAHCR